MEELVIDYQDRHRKCLDLVTQSIAMSVRLRIWNILQDGESIPHAQKSIHKSIYTIKVPPVFVY